MDIDSFSPQSGMIIGEDGKLYNIVSLLGGGDAVSDRKLNIDAFSPRTGRYIGEDGKVYNIVDLLKNLSGGTGSGNAITWE